LGTEFRNRLWSGRTDSGCCTRVEILAGVFFAFVDVLSVLITLVGVFTSVLAAAITAMSDWFHWVTDRPRIW
jgi:hypothetical protein